MDFIRAVSGWLVAVILFIGISSWSPPAQSTSYSGPPYYGPSAENGGLPPAFPSIDSAAQATVDQLCRFNGPDSYACKCHHYVVYLDPDGVYRMGIAGEVRSDGTITFSDGTVQNCATADGQNQNPPTIAATSYFIDPGLAQGGPGDGTGCKSCQPATGLIGNPINAAPGNKFQREADYIGDSSLQFVRFYNSLQTGGPGTVDSLWRHIYSRSITVTAFSDGTSKAKVYRPDGKAFTYKKVNGLWSPLTTYTGQLIELDDATGNVTGWVFRSASNDVTENYNALGQLTTIVDPSTATTTFTYSDATTPSTIAPRAGLLLTVTNEKGRKLTLRYNAAGNLATLTLPDGNQITYGYDSAGRLSVVAYPDTYARHYVYNESTLTSGLDVASSLTGIVDENGDRYASFGYARDTTGLFTNGGIRAVSTTHADGSNSYSMVDGGNSNLKITTPLGASTIVTFNRSTGLPTVES